MSCGGLREVGFRCGGVSQGWARFGQGCGEAHLHVPCPGITNLPGGSEKERALLAPGASPALILGQLGGNLKDSPADCYPPPPTGNCVLLPASGVPGTARKHATPPLGLSLFSTRPSFPDRPAPCPPPLHSVCVHAPARPGVLRAVLCSSFLCVHECVFNLQRDWELPEGKGPAISS